MDWQKIGVVFDFATRLWRKTLNMRSSSLTGIRATCQRCKSVKQINRYKLNIKHTCGKSCVGSAVAGSGLGGNGEFALTSLTIGQRSFSFSGVACLGDFRTGSSIDSSFCPSSWLSSRLRFKMFSGGTVDVSDRISNCKRKKNWRISYRVTFHWNEVRQVSFQKPRHRPCQT